MKIAILTQPLHTNYGGILQAFALQKVLEKMGHKALVVDLPNRKTRIGKYKRTVIRIIKKYILGQKDSSPIFRERPTSEEEKKIAQHTNRFIQENISTTCEIPFVENLDLLKKYHFDAYIVGSDQVWRPQYSPGIYAFFLNFLGNDKITKRIAYAASFGVDFWEFNKKQTQQCKILAQKFDSISVREDSGVKLCEKYLGVKAIQLADPTMLLSKDEYLSLISNYEIPNRKESIMVYILDKTSEKDLIVQRVIQHFNLPTNIVLPSKSFSKESRKFINECVFPPVPYWIQGFEDASFIITDSFHGTVFSIIFNKPFIVIGNKERGLSRFISLLSMFGLENRLIASVDEFDSEFLDKPIDFSIVNKIKDEQQSKSYDFLYSLLKK